MRPLYTIVILCFTSHFLLPYAYDFTISSEICGNRQYREGSPYDENLNYVKDLMMKGYGGGCNYQPSVYGHVTCHMGFAPCKQFANDVIHILERDCPNSMGAQLNTTDGRALRYDWYNFIPWLYD